MDLHGIIERGGQVGLCGEGGVAVVAVPFGVVGVTVRGDHIVQAVAVHVGQCHGSPGDGGINGDVRAEAAAVIAPPADIGAGDQVVHVAITVHIGQSDGQVLGQVVGVEQHLRAEAAPEVALPVEIAVHGIPGAEQHIHQSVLVHVLEDEVGDGFSAEEELHRGREHTVLLLHEQGDRREGPTADHQVHVTVAIHVGGTQPGGPVPSRYGGLRTEGEAAEVVPVADILVRVAAVAQVNEPIVVQVLKDARIGGE